MAAELEVCAFLVKSHACILAQKFYYHKLSHLDVQIGTKSIKRARCEPILSCRHGLEMTGYCWLSLFQPADLK